MTPGEPACTSVGVDCSGPSRSQTGPGQGKTLWRPLHLPSDSCEPRRSSAHTVNGLPRQWSLSVRGPQRATEIDEEWPRTELRRGAERVTGRGGEVGRIQRELKERRIDWRYDPPAASHMGGVWERQIRSVRRVLAGLTTEQLLTDESLCTLMCVAEGIINNRPLTTVSNDPQDMEPLTPNHLLLLRPARAPPSLFTEEDKSTRKRWRQVQYLADLF